MENAFYWSRPAQQQSEVCYLTRSSKETLQTYSLSAPGGIPKEPEGGLIGWRWKRLAIRAGFVGQIQARVKQVVIVNPHQFEVIRKSVKKTDRHDARALAQFLSKDLLPEARLKDERAAQINSLAETRTSWSSCGPLL